MSTEENETPEEKVRGGNTGRIISIIVGAVLVGAVALFAILYFQEKEKNIETEDNNLELTAEIEDLEQDIEDFQLDLENQDLAIEEKERILDEKETLLEEKQRRIDRLLKENKISRERAELLAGKVEQLEFYIRRYQDEIDELKEEVAMLTEERDDLKTKVNNMGQANQDLKRSVEEKDFRLGVASVLDATKFSSYYIRSSGKKVPENPIRRGRMKHFEICFDIFKNPSADIGPRDIYLQITGPTGAVVKHNEWASGYVTIDDQDVAYTGKKTIEYDRTTQQVCMDFEQPDDFEYEKGDHSVKVFCEGFEIGSSSFAVK